jgi:ABC-type transporter Mla subunit MlaD
MRKFVLALIIVLGFGFTWLVFRKPHTHDQNLKSYFQCGSSLKAGAPVCVDGVKVGVVKSVRVRPELGDRPMEVLMSLSAPYELKIK